MKATRKIKVTSYQSDDLSVIVYSSGGVTHSAWVTHYIDEAGHTKTWQKTFTGNDSRTRAIEYAESIIV